MTKKSKLSLLAVRWHSILMLQALIALVLFACSGSDSSEDPIVPAPGDPNQNLSLPSEPSSSSIAVLNTVKKQKIYGVSQKGPFAKGATVNIYELDANFDKTKNSFKGKTDGKGNFEIDIKGGELATPHIIVEVSGYYANEVSGRQSDAPITLKSIADVSEKDSVNVNVLTHLEHDKILELAKSGVSFEEATRTAQASVLNAFGISLSGIDVSNGMNIFGPSKSDSVLLAVSVLLQGSRTTEEVSSLLTGLGSEIKTSGTLSEQLKSEVANGLANVDMGELKDNILKLDPAAKVPGFEDIKNAVVKIDSTAALPIDPNAPSEPSSSSGAAPSSSSIAYSPTPSPSPSPSPTPTPTPTPIPSSSSAVSSSSAASGACAGFAKGTTRLHEGRSKAQFCDTRDGTKYVYVNIGNQTWMAENLRYSTADSSMGRCAQGKSENCDTYGRLYTLDEMFCKSGCKEEQWGVADPNSHIVNIACPAGWHLPSTTELEELLAYADPNFVAGTEALGTGRNSAGIKLKATSGWGSNNGTDDYGFSALSGGYCGGGCTNVVTGTQFFGQRSFWWSHAYGAPVPLAKSWSMTNSDGVVNDAYQSYSTSAFYVRCLENKTASVKTAEPTPQPIACTGSGAAGQKCHFGKWKDYFTDLRDHNEYPYVEIGDKYWMAANLDYDAPNSKCYNDIGANCHHFGRLYNFASASEACPAGWTLPTNAEWTALTTAIGGLTGTAAKLKAASGWATNGTDDVGFAGLPGSYGNLSTGNYSDLSQAVTEFGSAKGGFWWSSTKQAANGAVIRHIGPSSANITSVDNDFSRLYSVRCVKPKPVVVVPSSSSSEPEPSSSSVEVEVKYFTDTRDGNIYGYVKIGTQTWMAENLKFYVEGSKCVDPAMLPYWDPANWNKAPAAERTPKDFCDEYPLGRVYSWTMAMKGAESSTAEPSGVQGICPTGWHIPSNAEWSTLFAYAGGTSAVGASNLKSEKTSIDYGWGEGYNPGINKYGFSALPLGSVNQADEYNIYPFESTSTSNFMTATQNNATQSKAWSLAKSSIVTGNISKNKLHSLRCVKD